MEIIKKLVMFVLSSVWMVVKILLVSVIFKIVRPIIMPRGRNRIRFIVFAVFLVIFFLGNLAYPVYWNRSADWVNPKLNVVNVPDSIEQLDKWGIFRTLDEKIFIKQFPDFPFSLGLDLEGGVRLVYEADSDTLSSSGNIGEAMEGLRDVIEQRVNLFGVSEPIVYVESSGESQRLVVELAGVHDTGAAINIIGETPSLEFKEERPDAERKQFLEGAKDSIPGLTDEAIANRAQLCTNGQFIFLFASTTGLDPCFADTGLDGSYLDNATVDFENTTGQPLINLQFNSEGAELFQAITARNIGKPIAIYLDGVPRSTPTVQAEISGGRAQITGSFTLDEAKDTVRYLNAGALPVPMLLISQQTVGATLGEASINASITAGIWGLVFVMLFLVILYKFAGVLSVIALMFYLVILMAVIKLIPITLTLPGIAGIILSLGMAVDANILIFERLREELKKDDVPFAISVDRAFQRAWTSIRDGNISTLLTALILFFFSTSFIKGFALTLAIGVAISMFSAMIVTKYLIKWFTGKGLEKYPWLWTR